MTQPVPLALADLVEVTLIYDPTLGSPAETQALGGRVLALPPSLFPLPQQGVLLGLRGFGRQQVVAAPTPQNPDATRLRWEWVLQGDVDPMDQFVDQLTGRPGWLVPASRATTKLSLQRLLAAGVPRTGLAQQFPLLYQAIAAEVRAEVAAGG